MTKQEWRMQLQAEQEALLQALGTLLEKARCPTFTPSLCDTLGCMQG